MITLEQKKKLQFDAGIPHLPTDLTYECRIAIAGEGERGWEWQDKPHRLVYDLCRQVEADADRIDELVKERDDYAHKLMASGNTYTEMHLEIERLSDKLAKAVEALQVLSCKCTSNCDWDRGDICPSWTARTVLAELEGE